ncbi:MAG: branched-chain amino acid ABC transporter permease [Propionibacteriaceae bacterium]|nr:branched-chain amino acid ABC transporter permease [Propionibacteriaceae bacterium]
MSTAAPAPTQAKRPKARPVAAIGGVIAVVVLAALPLLALPGLGILPGPTYTPGSLHLLAMCWLIGALALSYHLLFGVAGLLSFGHALYFGVGVYGLGIVLANTDLPLLPAAALVLVGGIVIAHIIGAISLRVTGISFAMVTLAFAQAGNVLVRRNPGHSTGGEEGLALATAGVPVVLIGVVNTRNLYWLALAVLVLVFLVVHWIERSRAGHLIAATRENEMRVRVLGGSPYVVKLVTFVIAATLATIVGMAYLLLQSGAQPRATSADFTLTLLVMVVLGGVGSRIGAVIGGVLYTLLDQRLGTLASSPAIANLPPFLHIPLSEPLFILGTLFILVVLFLPGGLSGALNRLNPRRSERADPRETLEEVL